MIRRTAQSLIISLGLVFLTASYLFAQEAESEPKLHKQQNQEAGKPDIQNNDVKLFIDKIEVEGRLEKPQVMLFLPGQTPEIDDIQIERSFMKNIFRPVEKRITVETKFRAEYTSKQKSVIEW